MKCCALNMDLKRCNKLSTKAVIYHGDHEMYGSWTDSPEPSTVVTYLCKLHRKKEVQR